MEAEMDSHNFGDWASDAFAALNNDGHSSSEKWPAFNSTLSIPPSLLTNGSVERFGQVTPPEELSPTEPRLSSPRESSIPLELLKEEMLFPDHQLQALQDYQPQPSPQHSPAHDGQEPSVKRRRTTKQSSANQQSARPATPQPQQDAPQQPKRKRGRPKSQPQMVEAFTSDGFPFQISSARQSHLEKNRVAAHKCRQRKKEYINGLEDRARIFATKNKALKENVAMLREEVLELKNEVLRHAGCGFWAVDEYLAQCAGDLLSTKVAVTTPKSNNPSSSQSPPQTTMTLDPGKMLRESSAESLPSSAFMDSLDHDDYAGLDLLEDMDEDHGDRI